MSDARRNGASEGAYELLKVAGTTVLGAIFGLGFVAVIGGGVLLARFRGAGLPSEQAVSLQPKATLLSVGGENLALFILCGLVAVMLLVILELTKGDRFAPSMIFAVVAAIEVVAFVGVGWRALAAGRDTWAPWVAAIVAVLAIFVAPRVRITARRAPDEPASTPRTPTMRWEPRPSIAAARDARITPVLVVAAGLLIAAADLYGNKAWIAFFALAVLAATQAVLCQRIATEVRERRAHPEAGKLDLALAGVVVLVFSGIIVYGAAATTAASYLDPHVRPLVFRVAGWPHTQCGLYVGQTDDRLYVAEVGITSHNRADHDLGRLLAFPRDRVVSLSIGAGQRLGKAITHAHLIATGSENDAAKAADECGAAAAKIDAS